MIKKEIIELIEELEKAKKQSYTDIRFVEGRIYQLKQFISPSIVLKEKKKKK